MVKIGPVEEEQKTTAQRAVNKTLWLIGTSRNAILVVLCGFVGYWFSDTDYIKLIGMKLTYLTISFIKLRTRSLPFL